MNEIKFGVFTDLHYDHIPDGDKRIEFLIEQVKDKHLDFIIELGDFSHPTEKNRGLLDKIRALKVLLYYSLNAMSYIWVGPQYEHFSYTEEIHNHYPYLKDLVLYEQGLFTTVTINDSGGINIEGMNGGYQNVSPIELGIGDRWNGRSIQPLVPSYYSE